MSRPLTTARTTISTPSPIRETLDVSVLVDDDTEPRGVVVFCHGLGMGADTYAELRARWASDRFIVASPEFSDSLRHLAVQCPDRRVDVSDPTAWMQDDVVVGRALEMMFDPVQWLGRVIDTSSVIDQLGAVVGRSVDIASLPVVVAGHSYGAHTAQIVAGAAVDRGDGPESFRHPRVSGAILMSPQGSGERGLTTDSWSSIDLPWFVISGEHDIAARGQGVEWRRQAYDLTPVGGRFLAVVPGADHGLGGIAGPAPIYRDDREMARHVADLTSQFLGSFAEDVAFVPDTPFRTESK